MWLTIFLWWSITTTVPAFLRSSGHSVISGLCVSTTMSRVSSLTASFDCSGEMRTPLYPPISRWEISSFERFAPQKIKESYERKEAEQNTNDQAQQKIDQRINQIEQSNLYSGQVENKQIYVTVKQVKFPQSMVFTEAELQEQALLRREFIDDFRRNLRSQLDNIDIQEADGSITNLGEKYGSKIKEGH